jgi:hypothetical protein
MIHQRYDMIKSCPMSNKKTFFIIIIIIPFAIVHVMTFF